MCDEDGVVRWHDQLEADPSRLVWDMVEEIRARARYQTEEVSERVDVVN